MKILHKITFFILLAETLFAQYSVKGIVIDENQKPIPFVSIVIKSVDDGKVVSFTNTNNDGVFSLTIKNGGNYLLMANMLAYSPFLTPFEVNQEKNSFNQTIRLRDETIELNEIIVQASSPIKVKKDTILIDAKSFIQGNESVLEDLLKKIPGINVSTDGTIKVGNKEIEKIMIEGDDFFENGYKLISKNVPVSPIAKIEILQHFSTNKLLKGIENSEKVALNLKLEENAKSKWLNNANVGLGIGNEARYDLKNNLMNFGTKNKYYFLSSFNNIGSNTSDDVVEWFKPMSLDGETQSTSLPNYQSFVKLLFDTPHFKKSRTNFNNDKLLSANAIFNPSPKLKIKTTGLINMDKNLFFKSEINSYIGRGTDFSNQNTDILTKSISNASEKINFLYSFSPKKTVEFSSQYTINQEKNTYLQDFNKIKSNQYLSSFSKRIDNRAILTYQLSPSRVILINARYLYEYSPQRFNSDRFYKSMESISNPKINQMTISSSQYAGIDCHYYSKTFKGNLFELRLSNELLKDKLNATTEVENTIQNKTDYLSNDIYLDSKYTLKLGKISLVNQLAFHQLYNQLSNNENKIQQSPSFLNTTIGINWEINKNQKLMGSYIKSHSNTKITDVYDYSIATSNRTMETAYGKPSLLGNSMFLLNYQSGNWGKKIFMNHVFFFNLNHNYFTNNVLLNKNYALYSKILAKNQELYNISSDISFHLNPISSNLKFEAKWTQTTFANVVNGIPSNQNISQNFHYGVELRSGFAGVFNYHCGTNWSKFSIRSTFQNSYANQLIFMDLDFSINNLFNLSIQSERYIFGNTNPKHNAYYFMDIESRYNYKPNKLSFSVSLRNLFNTTTFQDYAINDISYSVTNYRLLPRYLLIKTEIRI